MPSRRLPLFSVALVVGVALLLMRLSRGEAQSVLPFDVTFGPALPAVDVGVVPGKARLTGTTEAVRRGIRTGAGSNDILSDDGSRVVRGRLVVKFRDGMSIAARASAVSDVLRTAALADRRSDANFDTVSLDPMEDPQPVARALARRTDVEYAQPVHRVYPQLVPNDPLYKELQWNLPLIDLERAWEIQPQAGSSITVAVIDTGVAYTNATITASLPARRVEGTLYPSLGTVTIPYAAAFQLGPTSRFVAPRDFICGNTLPSLGPLDFDGHGTHVSGTIGQLTNDSVGTAGVAFNVRIMPIKVLASFWDVILGCASETGGSDDDVARGIRYAADNGAKIINLSLGGPGPSGSAPVMEDAIKYTIGKGVFIAIAAGNDFEDGNPTEQPAEIANRVKGAVSIASVDPNKSHAPYSSSGPWIELSAPGGSSRGFDRRGFIFQQTFDFAFTDTFDPEFGPYRAPRFDVLGYLGYIGTSQATPHVSGLAAMLMQQGITDPTAVEEALEKFATYLGSPCAEAPCRNNLTGFGLVNARNALFGLGAAK